MNGATATRTSPLRCFLHGWWWMNAAIAAASVLALCLWWKDLDPVRRTMLGQFVFINLHFVEEFRLPGGFPWLANTIEAPSDSPSGYPLNQWTACLGNNWFAFLVYLPAFLLPQVHWLTMSVTTFGFVEVLMHALYFPGKLKRWYNPGWATACLGMLPLSLTFLVVIPTQPWWVYLAGLLFPMANYVIVFRWLLCGVLATPDTRYPFTPGELRRGLRWTSKVRSSEAIPNRSSGVKAATRP